MPHANLDVLCPFIALKWDRLVADHSFRCRQEANMTKKASSLNRRTTNSQTHIKQYFPGVQEDMKGYTLKKKEGLVHD
jgi:hypothetical protein